MTNCLFTPFTILLLLFSSGTISLQPKKVPLKFLVAEICWQLHHSDLFSLVFIDFSFFICWLYNCILTSFFSFNTLKLAWFLMKNLWQFSSLFLSMQWLCAHMCFFDCFITCFQQDDYDVRWYVFGFVLFEVCTTSWIPRFIVFIKCEIFSDTISSNIFSFPCPFLRLQLHVCYCPTSHSSYFTFLFFTIFYLCAIFWIFSITLFWSLPVISSLGFILLLISFRRISYTDCILCLLESLLILSFLSLAILFYCQIFLLIWLTLTYLFTLCVCVCDRRMPFF